MIDTVMLHVSITYSIHASKEENCYGFGRDGFERGAMCW